MTTYCATFGALSCEIEVEAKPTVGGQPVYVASAFISEDDGDTLRPVYKGGRPVELPQADEASAVNRLAAFLERKIGTLAAPPAVCPKRHRIQVQGAPWELPEDPE